MSLWSRIGNALRGQALNREIDEEMQSHMDEAIASGRDPEEVRRAFGSKLRKREESRDVKLLAWIDALRADLVFGWRQILKNRTASAVAILSLALAVGSCTTAFRLIDALLLRPLPVAHPERLFFLGYEYRDADKKIEIGDAFDYPTFRLLRAAVADQAEVMAISYNGWIGVTYGDDKESERAFRQYVSGWTFSSFGLKPALGRLFTKQDDVKPGGHPQAVISYDYWTRRFGRDPSVLGRKFRSGLDSLEIVGVAPEGFGGTETGSLTDVFVPTMMNAKAIEDNGWGWFRTWVHLRPGVEPEVVRQKLRSTLAASRREIVKTWGPSTLKDQVEAYLRAEVVLESASAGVSGMQKTYRRSLIVLGALVGLVLLIACANVANLMSAQAATRAREMALRVSIGAGRYRLTQLVLVESALIATFSSALGGLFAWWSAPFVIGLINPPDNPARFLLHTDWRVVGFGILLTLSITILFGIAPALRASSIQPASALKGGENPHSKRRLMNTLIAAQVAFCFLIHFVAGLFVSTFDRLSNQPTGFSSERVLVIETAAKTDQSIESWEQTAAHLRLLGPVESVSVGQWALLSGNSRWGQVLPGGKQSGGEFRANILGVAPGWMETLKIPLLSGRDFRSADDQQVAIVNEAFAKVYCEGQNPVGKFYETTIRKKRVRTEIVGFMADSRYSEMRSPIRPTIYSPFRTVTEDGKVIAKDWGTFLVRTRSAEPSKVANLLRVEISRAHSAFRVASIHTQEELVRAQTVRERLLALLSIFFAVVALVLAAVGLYGVLDYSVLQRRREIGIRIALGARADDIVRRVTSEVFSMLVLGSVVGLAIGMASERYFATLLYQVKATDLSMLLVPAITILTAAIFAALPPVIRAIRIDPSIMLRSE